MDIANPDAFLAVARERRKVMMRSTCRITRPGGEREFDPDTGEYSKPVETVVYEGVCHLMSRAASAITEAYKDFASGEVALERVPVAIPWDAPRIDNGDSMTFLASDDQWAINRGPFPVGWVRYADSRTHRVLFVLAQDRPGVNDA